VAKGKVIISCAVTGAIHTPSMSPHLPITAEEIAEASVGAAEAAGGGGSLGGASGAPLSGATGAPLCVRRATRRAGW
jgi:hypothetical protein